MPGRRGAPVEALPPIWSRSACRCRRTPDDLVVALLVRALSLLDSDTATAMAEEVGESYGRNLAAQMAPGEGQRSMHAAMLAVADALTAHGFAAHGQSTADASSNRS